MPAPAPIRKRKSSSADEIGADEKRRVLVLIDFPPGGKPGQAVDEMDARRRQEKAFDAILANERAPLSSALPSRVFRPPSSPMTMPSRITLRG
ncbi:MAG: hypothetical protein R3C55_11820 [Parvularculaceae bacterium]